MTKLEILPGRHTCGRLMDARIFPVEDDEKENKAWTIYGACKKCNIVIVLGLFLQQEEPKQNVDYMIDSDLVAVETEPVDLKKLEV